MIAIDTNILVYAEGGSDPHGRDVRAKSIITSLMDLGAVVSLQVLGEFLNVCGKKKLLSREHAIKKIANYAVVFETPATSVEDLQAAATRASRFDLQFFDALIITIAARAGATILLSEDMQDGFEIGGLGIINPFLDVNAKRLDELLNPAA